MVVWWLCLSSLKEITGEDWDWSSRSSVDLPAALIKQWQDQDYIMSVNRKFCPSHTWCLWWKWDPGVCVWMVPVSLSSLPSMTSHEEIPLIRHWWPVPLRLQLPESKHTANIISHISLVKLSAKYDTALLRQNHPNFMLIVIIRIVGIRSCVLNAHSLSVEGWFHHHESLSSSVRTKKGNKRIQVFSISGWQLTF